MEENNQPRSFFKKFWWICVLVVLLLVSIVLALLVLVEPERSSHTDDEPADIDTVATDDDGESEPTDEGWPSEDEKYITAVPVDLSQIESISKYRSCAGHDRSGYNFEKTLETDRSMKHYFYPAPEFVDTTDQVKLYAPFDGTVLTFVRNSNKFPGRIDGSISFSTPLDPNVSFTFGHINAIRDFTPGEDLTAGDFIGYAATYEGGDFDLDLTAKHKRQVIPGNDESSVEILGSIFDHMTNPVLTEFAEHGLTPQNTKFSEEFRDANPCNYPDVDESHLGRENDDWIRLDQ